MKYFIIILLFVSACQSSQKANVPENLIPKQKLIEVFVDLSIHEELVVSELKNIGQYYKSMRSVGDSILKAHNTTREIYESSLGFYSQDYDQLKDIYDQSLELLGEKLGEVQEE